MSESLKAIITADATRPVVVDDCVALVETEVSGKGLLIRGAYKTVKKIKPGFVRAAVDGLLDEWLDKMEPYYQDWKSSGAGSFSDKLAGQKSEVANDLLTVTDARAETSEHKTAAKMYTKLRPTALKNVEQAVPGLADIIEKHL